MINGFFLKKGQMTQVFLDNGKCLAVTSCLAPPAYIIRRIGKDKVQVAFGKKRKASAALSGLLKKAGIKSFPYRLAEFTLNSPQEKIKEGSPLDFSQVFEEKAKVAVTAYTKGRGFAGVIKRWGFHSQPKTHGQSDRERAPGSIGAQTPGRVLKGKKMPGHHGFRKHTIKNLKVIKLDKDNSLLLISGSVPGPIKGWLRVNIQK